MTAAAARPPAGPRPLRTVLVDDTPDLRLLMKVALHRSGLFEVVGEAGDGLTGVEMVRRERPDVVLLDLAMPVMDGLEALGHIRRASPETRAVILSAFEAERMAARACAAGAVGYVQKGAAAPRLVSQICQTLGLPDARRAVRRGLERLDGPAESANPASELTRVQEALAAAAHELRGPATVLLAMSELLSSERNSLDSRTFDRMLDAMARQARVLDRVTGDLLTSTQSQRGVLTVAVEPLPLQPLIEEAALTVADRLPVEIDCDPTVAVLADPTRVQQMLTNLLMNAVKYAAPPVSVTAHQVGAKVEICVADCGAGVPTDFRDRLFEQFTRAAGTRASGMGLGLFVVGSLARAQGGRAWYRPAPSGGAAFCFTLPLADQPAELPGELLHRP